MGNPIQFSFLARLTNAGIQRAHHYLDKSSGGGHGEGKFVPELHLVLDANRGDGYSPDGIRGALNIHFMEPELVRQIAQLWWDHGLKTFDHEAGDWHDPGRITFRVTLEQVDE